MSDSTYTDERIVALYDALHSGVPFLAPGPAGEPPEDARFYLGLIGKPPRRVLELGSGTGRVAIPLAQAGHDVTGLDASRPMVEAARRKVARLPPEVQARLQFVEGSWYDYDLQPGSYQAAVCPFTSFQRNLTIEQQDRFLALAARHLTPGGILLLDLFFPNLSMLAEREAPRFENRRLTLDGVEWVEHATLTRHPAAQTFDCTFDYQRADGTGPSLEHRFTLTWFLPRELERVVAASPLELVEILDGYGGEAVHDDSERQVVVARRPPR